MKTQTPKKQNELEQQVVHLTRVAHPNDLGRETSILEKEIRQTLLTAEKRGMKKANKTTVVNSDELYEKVDSCDCGNVNLTNVLEELKIKFV